MPKRLHQIQPRDKKRGLPPQSVAQKERFAMKILSFFHYKPFRQKMKGAKMNELIKVDNNTQAVSARELHKALEIEKRFSAWFETNSQGFVEGED